MNEETLIELGVATEETKAIAGGLYCEGIYIYGWQFDVYCIV